MLFFSPITNLNYHTFQKAMENITTSICIQFASLLLALGRFTSIILYNFLFFKKTPPPPPLPPGPTGYPILGSLPEMLKNKPAFRWMHKLLHEHDTEIACIRLGNTHVILVTSPDLAREFLKKHDAIFASRPNSLSAKLTSNGYLTAVLSPTGNQWKKMRRIVTSEVLSSSLHRKLHEKRREEADHLIKYVYNQCQNTHTNGVLNVREAAQHYCGNVMRKLLFGMRFFGGGMEDGGPGNEEREHVVGAFKALSYMYGFAIADYFPWLEVVDLDGHKKIITDALKSVRKYQDLEINKRVEMWQRGVLERQDDILDVLINLKDSNNNPLLSVQEIKAQITEIMLAAIDNPSNAVEWAIAEMINHPYILDMASQELDRVVGKHRLVQESDLSKLNYVKACIKETFRLHPVSPFNLPHVSTKDTVVGGHFIPKGSHVLLSRLGLGRNPRSWDDPLKFKPERHFKDEGSEHVVLVDQELRMLSFSIGRRGCPGIELGSTIATILLARLIQGFSWRAPPKKRKIDLVESDGDLLLREPLIAQAMPRLDPQLYLQLE